MATVAKNYGPRLVDEGILRLSKPPADTTPQFSKIITTVPGMHPITLSDYHSGLWVHNHSDPFFQFVVGEHSNSLHQLEWVLDNSVHELERN